MKQLFFWASAVFVLIALPSCKATPRPIPIGENTTYYGNIVEGNKFGVSVGEPIERASSVLQKAGFYFTNEFGCEEGLGKIIVCNQDGLADSYRVKQMFRDGYIFILKKEGKVAGIAWTFSLFPQPDF